MYFESRAQAGQLLAAQVVDKYRYENCAVVALTEGGVLVGDVDDAVRQRSDITITPQKGGVGPLTYAVLFDHLIEACLRQVGKL
mgnify:FL=1